MSKPNFSLEDKVAIVTGARRGIGKEIALTFAEAGADVAVCDMVVEGGELEAVAKQIQGFGRRSLVAHVDVSRKADVDNMVQRVVDEFSSIDILVNNAGAGDRYPMLEVREDIWDKIINTDLKGYFLFCQAVGNIMTKQKEGSIINMASTGGIRVGEYGWKRVPGYGVGHIAKAGVVMLTRVLCQELGSYNIRVNAIAPSSVKTPMSITWNNPEEEKRTATFMPLGRVAEPSEIAAAALFLASDASSYITGDTLPVDGGMLA